LTGRTSLARRPTAWLIAVGDSISVQLVHRRLSIIDLRVGGCQLLTIDGLTLGYNGELYSYRTLKAELTVFGVLPCIQKSG
jgi:asparagine synthetase B (glutamine-hydrolysing)